MRRALVLKGPLYLIGSLLAVGLWLGASDLEGAGAGVFAGLLIAGGLLWILASLSFALIKEQPGATEGGGNALSVAIGQLRLLVDDMDLGGRDVGVAVLDSHPNIEVRIFNPFSRDTARLVQFITLSRLGSKCDMLDTIGHQVQPE